MSDLDGFLVSSALSDRATTGLEKDGTRSNNIKFIPFKTGGLPQPPTEVSCDFETAAHVGFLQVSSPVNIR